MVRNDAIKLLNDLIHTSEDGEQGFHQAAHIARNPALVDFFEECANECRVAADELQAKVLTLGGQPADGGSIAGAAHRGWMLAKSAVATSDLSVVEEVERGEDQAKAMYSKALKRDLPADVHELVKRQAEGAVRTHNRIRDLRNSMRQPHG